LALALGALALLALQLAACAKTTYRAYGDAAKDEDLLMGREVTYRLERAIYTTLPQCAVVLPAGGKAPPAIARLAGPALARYLGGRIPRVIGPAERRRLEKHHRVDLGHAGDRRHFAKATGCKTYLRWRVLAAEDKYFLVWSQRRIGIEAALHRAGDDGLLWQAAHIGRRSDGSLPLSAFSVPFAAFEATNFKGDGDVLPSMVDDVVRRLMVTLPDLR
jgi:hypothetical protein